MRDQILAFLAQGFSKADVLKTVGCSEALYDEITAAPAFINDLATKRTEFQQERVERHYNKLEEKVLKKLTDDLEYLEPAQLCRVLDTVARNKVAYRKPSNTYQNPTIHQSVTLMLPQAAINQKIVLDSQNQVLAIGERVMASLPIQGVKELFANFDVKQREQTIKEIENDLAIPDASPA